MPCLVKQVPSFLGWILASGVSGGDRHCADTVADLGPADEGMRVTAPLAVEDVVRGIRGSARIGGIDVPPKVHGRRCDREVLQFYSASIW